VHVLECARGVGASMRCVHRFLCVWMCVCVCPCLRSYLHACACGCGCGQELLDTYYRDAAVKGREHMRFDESCKWLGLACCSSWEGYLSASMGTEPAPSTLGMLCHIAVHLVRTEHRCLSSCVGTPGECSGRPGAHMHVCLHAQNVCNMTWVGEATGRGASNREEQCCIQLDSKVDSSQVA
jgi:hypothetical protein